LGTGGFSIFRKPFDWLGPIPEGIPPLISGGNALKIHSI